MVVGFAAELRGLVSERGGEVLRCHLPIRPHPPDVCMYWCMVVCIYTRPCMAAVRTETCVCVYFCVFAAVTSLLVAAKVEEIYPPQVCSNPCF